MLKLYYAPHTRAFRPRWLLEELEVPYQIVRVDFKNPSKLYDSIHPHGCVPAIEDLDEGISLIESGAICAYLGDRYLDKKLVPKLKALERGLYYGWLFYATVTVEPLVDAYYRHTAFLPEDERNPDEAARAKSKFLECAAYLETQLQYRDHILKSGFSVADVVLGSMLEWAGSLSLIDDFKALRGYVTRLKSRPAFKRAKHD